MNGWHASAVDADEFGGAPLPQSNPVYEEVAALFAGEAEFVAELVALLQAGDAIPEDIRTLSLRALAVQILDRTRHGSVINAVARGGQAGLLSSLMHAGVTSMVGGGASGGGGASVPPRHSVAFMEALLSLIGALVASTTGGEALRGMCSAAHVEHRCLLHAWCHNA